MAISKIWKPRGDLDVYSNSYCTLLDAAYLVNYMEPEGPNADRPPKVMKSLRELTAVLINGRYPFPAINDALTSFNRMDTLPESTMVSFSFVQKWAHYYGVTNFFNPPETERRFIGSVLKMPPKPGDVIGTPVDSSSNLPILNKSTIDQFQQIADTQNETKRAKKKLPKNYDQMLKDFQPWLDDQLEKGVSLHEIKRMTVDEIKAELEKSNCRSSFITGWDDFWKNQQIIELYRGRRGKLSKR